MNKKINKFSSAFLFVLFIILFSSNLVEIIYSSINDTSKRGHFVEIVSAEKPNNESNDIKTKLDLDIKALLASSDVSLGITVFKKKCLSCHNTPDIDKGKVGPSLYNIIGRKIASRTDFNNYSKILKEYNLKETLWTEENLFAYISEPKKFAKGGNMAFAGIKDQKELGNLLKYIESQRMN